MASTNAGGKGRLFELGESGVRQIAEVWHSTHGKPDFKQASAVLILVDPRRLIRADSRDS